MPLLRHPARIANREKKNVWVLAFTHYCTATIKRTRTHTALTIACCLLIVAGCEYDIDSKDDDTLPGVEFAQVDPFQLEALEAVIRTLAVRMVDAFEDNAACISPPYDSDDIASLEADLDDLFGQLGHEITRVKFSDQLATLDSTDFAEVDSAAANILRREATDLWGKYEAGCPEMAQVRETAETVFNEHLHVIRTMDSSALQDFVASIVNDQYAQGQGWCKFRCYGRSGAIVIGLAGFIIVCQAPMVLPVVGQIAMGTCVTIVITAGAATIISQAAYLWECLQECDEDERAIGSRQGGGFRGEKHNIQQPAARSLEAVTIDT